MHGDNLSYAESFGAALKGLFSDRTVAPETGGTESVGDLATRANTAFESYLRLLSEQRFAEAAEQLEALRDTLRRMAASGEGEKRPK